MSTEVKNTVATPTPAAAAVPAAETPEVEREYVRPVVDIFETAEGYVLEAEMPGVGKQGLSVTVEGNFLTLEGRRTVPAALETEARYREFRGGDFYRVFQLDPAIDTAKVEATMEQGILTLTLPKREAVKPRQIKVA